MPRTFPIIPLAEWRPDSADLLSGYARVATNVVPREIGYSPWNRVGSTDDMAPLDARCQGAIAVKSPLDQIVRIVAGDATKLYQSISGSAVNVSRSGNYTVDAESTWEFAVADGRLIATHIADPLQGATLNTDPLAFANLATSTLQPQARHITVVGTQVLIGNTRESNVDYPNRVRWCAIDASGNPDPTDWDESQTTLADHQDIEGVGAVQRLVGRERYGLALMDHAIARLDFVGTPDVYAVSKYGHGFGCIAPQSVAQYGNDVFYLSRQGFVVTDGFSIRPIGNEKFDEWFSDRYDESLAHLMSAAIDRTRQLYLCVFPTTSATTRPDEMLVYHIPTGKAAVVELTNTESLDITYILESLTLGVTLEDLDTHPLGGTSIDAISPSFDSTVWAGGQFRLGAFYATHALRRFDGATATATVETAFVQPFPGRRARIDAVRPIADGGTLSCAVAAKERMNDSESFNTAVNQNSDGLCPFETSNEGRYVRVRARVAASGTWDYLEGVELRALPTSLY